jgi:hypothetical protein
VTAKHRALQALKQTGINPAPKRLTWFYDTNGNYAGASFAELRPIDPWDLTATDLHATMLLSVRIGPRATRRIVGEGATRAGLLCRLRQVPELDLAAAGRSELSTMADLYEAVKQALSADGVRRPNAWVTASKLCARKRPGLFPVRDKKVCDYLGLSPLADYQVDWQVFQSLVADPDIIAAVGTLTDATVACAPERNLRIDSSPLRLLDAAIWTYATSQNEPQR